MIAPFSISAPYVRGRQYETGRKKAGRFSIGRNSPDKKIMGNRKKFE
jgi:hypothetical protein